MATKIADGGAAQERRFYSGMAVAMIVIVFAGFAPSFFLYHLFSYPRPNPTMTPLTWLHGGVFTAWMGLFYTQARLVAANRRDLHMRLGVWGFGLATLMVPIVYFTAIAGIARANQPPYIDAVSWSAVPLSWIPPLVLFLVLGWRARRDAQTHKRFMLLSALLMMEPAIGRLPLLPPSFVAQYVVSAIAMLPVIPLVLWDRKTIGRLHWATQTGIAAMIAATLLRFVLWQTPAYHGFIGMIGG